MFTSGYCSSNAGISSSSKAYSREAAAASVTVPSRLLPDVPSSSVCDLLLSEALSPSPPSEDWHPIIASPIVAARSSIITRFFIDFSHLPFWHLSCTLRLGSPKTSTPLLYTLQYDLHTFPHCFRASRKIDNQRLSPYDRCSTGEHGPFCIFHGFGPDRLRNPGCVARHDFYRCLRRRIPFGKSGSAAGQNQADLPLVAKPDQFFFQKCLLIRKNQFLYHIKSSRRQPFFHGRAAFIFAFPFTSFIAHRDHCRRKRPVFGREFNGHHTSGLNGSGGNDFGKYALHRHDALAHPM